MFLQSLLVFSLAKPDPLPASIFALVHNVKMEKGGGIEKVEWRRRSGNARLVGIQFTNSCHFTRCTVLHFILLLLCLFLLYWFRSIGLCMYV